MKSYVWELIIFVHIGLDKFVNKNIYVKNVRNNCLDMTIFFIGLYKPGPS